MNLSKAFYRFNFWLCISLVICPIILAFLKPDHSSLDYPIVREQYLQNNYFFYKLASMRNPDDLVFDAFLTIYYYIVVFYILFFIKSYWNVKINSINISTLKKTRVFFIASMIIFIINVTAVLTGENGWDFTKFFCWAITLTIFFIALSDYQKQVLLKLKNYMIIFTILCLVPFLFIFIMQEMTLANYQFSFFFVIPEIESPLYKFSLIFSPISYLAMPLFFSFNHYITVKKLIMENTQEELPKDFFKFKFSFKDA